MKNLVMKTTTIMKPIIERAITMILIGLIAISIFTNQKKYDISVKSGMDKSTMQLDYSIHFTIIDE